MNMASDPNITAEMIEAAALAIADLIEKRHGGGLNMMGDARREEAKAALSAAFSVQPREGGGEWVGDKEYWEAPAAPVEPTSTPPALPLEPSEEAITAAMMEWLAYEPDAADDIAFRDQAKDGLRAAYAIDARPAAPVPPSQGEGWELCIECGRDTRLPKLPVED